MKGFNEQRKFAEVYCAVGYFRIPQFREKLLDVICKGGDP
jgi:hypothetical protein